MIRIFLMKLLCVAGLLLSLYLVRQHYHFATGKDIEQGLCGVVTVSRCSAVEASSFSEWFGIPTASFGAFYFLVFFLYLMLGHAGKTFGPMPLKYRPYWHGVILFTAIGFATSMVLAALSAFVIHAFCIGCAIVYCITLLNTALAAGFDPAGYVKGAVSGFWAIRDFLDRIFMPPRVPDAKIKIAAIVFVFALIAPLNFALPRYLIAKGQKVYSTNLLQRYVELGKFKFEVRPASLVRGPEDAPVQLVVFTDYECPHCKIFNDGLKKVLAKYSERQYRLVYKHFPLNAKCNPMVERYIMEKKSSYEHPRACEVAAMVQAFGETNKFWQYSSRFYEVQGKPELYPVLKSIADEAGVDYAQWAAHSKEIENLRAVVLDVGEGIHTGLTAIPALFINGRYSPSLKMEDVDFLIRLAPSVENRPSKTPGPQPSPNPFPRRNKIIIVLLLLLLILLEIPLPPKSPAELDNNLLLSRVS